MFGMVLTQIQVICYLDWGSALLEGFPIAIFANFAISTLVEVWKLDIVELLLMLHRLQLLSLAIWVRSRMKRDVLGCTSLAVPYDFLITVIPFFDLLTAQVGFHLHRVALSRFSQMTSPSDSFSLLYIWLVGHLNVELVKILRCSQILDQLNTIKLSSTKRSQYSFTSSI